MEINVTVEQVDLKAIVRVDRVETSEGVDEYPITLGEAVAEQIAHNLMSDSSYPELRAKVTELRDVEIIALLRPTIADAIAAERPKIVSAVQAAADVLAYAIHEAMDAKTTAAAVPPFDFPA